MPFIHDDHKHGKDKHAHDLHAHAALKKELAGKSHDEQLAHMRPKAPTKTEKLPEHVKAKLEHVVGADLDHVKVHHDESVAHLGAVAHAHGSEIHLHVAPKVADPHKEQAHEIIAHELKHAVAAKPEAAKAPDPAKKADKDKHAAHHVDMHKAHELKKKVAKAPEVPKHAAAHPAAPQAKHAGNAHAKKAHHG